MLAILEDKIMNAKKVFEDWIAPVLIAIILALLINKFLFFTVSIPSESMVPTIKVNDRIIVTRIYDRKKLKRGDIVVFYSKELNDTLIKRLIGLPGDRVEVVDGGQVFINGEKIEEPYVVYPDNLSKSFTVGEDKYLFFGDNRAISDDARRWDNPYIDGKDIKGKARFIVFPFRRAGEFVIGQEAVNH